jgi:hypothetical protein
MAVPVAAVEVAEGGEEPIFDIKIVPVTIVVVVPIVKIEKKEKPPRKKR